MHSAGLVEVRRDMTNTLRWLAGLALVALVATGWCLAQTPSRAIGLARSRHSKEVADGNLTGAIAHTRSILHLFPPNGRSAASALWHLGQCYERKHDARARQRYERLLNEYSDSAFADRARTRLARSWTRPWTPNQRGRAGAFLVALEIEQVAWWQHQWQPNNNNNNKLRDLCRPCVSQPDNRGTSSADDGKRSAAYPVVSPKTSRWLYLS
jgi:hypothetical protein